MPALPPTPIYHAAPPEVHSTLLNAGATAAGVVAAGTSWSHVAAEYVSGIAELEAILASVQATYQGPSAEQFILAHQPLLLWMQQVVIKATLAAVAHGEIAVSYESAVAMMPTMMELITNHVVHAALVGTNFFGVNTIPIGMNEADYVRMWNQAADVQTGYDGATGAAVASIPETLPPPPTLIPGVGETGSAVASAASFLTQGVATATGASLTTGNAIADKLIAGKTMAAPMSAANNAAQGSQAAPTDEARNAADQAGQQLKPENMGASMMQQFTSIASSAPQAASSAIQGPAQMLTQAPQMLASAPQQLSSMLSQFAGGFGSDLAGQSGFAAAGFPGTGAIQGFNPAGMTSLAGGALGSGPARPMMPSTWGSAPTASTDMSNAAKVSPVATGLPGAGAGGTGAGGSGMMGSGANNRRGKGSQQVTTYNEDADGDDAADADSDGGAYAMTR